MFVYTMQPVVQPVLSCKRGIMLCVLEPIVALSDVAISSNIQQADICTKDSHATRSSMRLSQLS